MSNAEGYSFKLDKQHFHALNNDLCCNACIHASTSMFNFTIFGMSNSFNAESEFTKDFFCHFIAILRAQKSIQYQSGLSWPFVLLFFDL